MSNDLILIDGKTYQFKLNGYACSGVYLLADEQGKESAFYCNGKAICFESEATSIHRLYDKKDLKDATSSLVAELLEGSIDDIEWCKTEHPQSWSEAGDKFPQHEETVLVVEAPLYANKSIQIATYFFDEEQSEYHQHSFFVNGKSARVTHWMPLPKLPNN